MKKLLPLFGLLLLFSSAYSQSYYYIKKQGTESNYVFTTSTGATVLVPRGSNDKLSASNSIPFAWTFFGQSVTSYKASDNGYITFDNSATLSQPANTLLPSATAPLNSIFAFWDDLELKAVPSNTNIKTEVRSFTYGSAPNRVHVIQWFTASPFGAPISNTNFLYFAIRLFEGGSFDVVHNYGITANPLSGTIGAQNADGTDGVMVSGSPNLTAPNPVGSYTGNNVDLVFQFIPGTQPSLDAAMISFSVPNSVASSANTMISGLLRNYGSQAITSLTLNYSVDEGATVSDNKSGLNIAGSGGAYNFTHATAWKGATPGQTHTIKVWASNLNGSADENPANDTLSFKVFVVNGTGAPKYVLIEEGSGAWCGYCPDGHLRLTDITKNDTSIIGVVHHNNDGMTNANSDAINATYQTGYPYGMVDRTLFSDQTTIGLNRGLWETKAGERKNISSPVSVLISKTYDEASRKIDFTVTANFVDYAQGDMRINAFLVEDKVRGNDLHNVWTQHNYYSSQFNGGAGGPSHPLYNEPEWLTGYLHNHVVRAIPSGTWGTAGVIPSTVSPGQNFSKSYTYTIPPVTTVTLPEINDDPLGLRLGGNGEGMNKPQDFSIVAFVSYYNADTKQREVLNAKEVSLLGISGINESKILASDVTIYPNPVNGTATVKFNLKSTSNVSVEIYNALGQKVNTLRNGSLGTGEHNLIFDASQYENGIYFLNITTNEGRTAKRFVVVK